MAERRSPVKSIIDERVDHLKERFDDTKEDLKIIMGKVDTSNEILSILQAQYIKMEANQQQMQRWQLEHDEKHDNLQQKKQKRKKLIINILVAILTAGISAAVSFALPKILNTEGK